MQALSRIRPSTREVSVNTENGTVNIFISVRTSISFISSCINFHNFLLLGTLEALRKQFDEKILEMNEYFKKNEEKNLLALETQHKVC